MNIINKWEQRIEQSLKYENFIEDLRGMIGMEELQLMEDQLIKELDTEINRNIIFNYYKLGEGISVNTKIYPGFFGNAHLCV